LAHYTRLPPTDTRPPGNSRTAKASEYGFGSARRRHRLDTSILRDAFIRGYGTHDGVLHAHGLSTPRFARASTWLRITRGPPGLAGSDARRSIPFDIPVDARAADLHLRLPALPSNFLVLLVVLVVQIPVLDGDALGTGVGQNIGRNTRDQIAPLHRCPQSTKRPKIR